MNTDGLFPGMSPEDRALWIRICNEAIAMLVSSNFVHAPAPVSPAKPFAEWQKDVAELLAECRERRQ